MSNHGQKRRPAEDICLGTRIRLARNLAKLPFQLQQAVIRPSK